MQQEHGTRVEGLGTQQDALIKALGFFFMVTALMDHICELSPMLTPAV